ncbi:putative E3 ubiquitin-protein ligase RING1a [Turnera subulata]|uniref:E3 ubiquitin-protein ligase RING1a n=1 Tax=Turnera subulata TaxID=218843 RepID=A0A9Q0GI42_9ROSI|nr:putative E3 ubiquitin-protein ligase RING1a [Turnera subulata]
MPAQKQRSSPHNSHSYDDDDGAPQPQEPRHHHEEEEEEEEKEEAEPPVNNHHVDDGEEEEEQAKSNNLSPPPLQNGHAHHRQRHRPPQGQPPVIKLDDDDDDEEEEAEAEAEEEEQQQRDEEDEEGGGEGEEDEQLEKEQGEEEEEDSENGTTSRSSSVSSQDDDAQLPEFVYVELPDVRKDVQCPICLGIIKKTRTVMECLHRFCRECIDKSMRLGNNECPACRTHCASRRSLRDDPNYDALIAALYPDIDKYEEEELAFHEEERNRNKQIQASIAQIFQRQSEALVKRRTMGKETTGLFMTRSQRYNRTPNSRKRRNSRGSEFQGSEDNEDENDDNGGKDSSSNDERSVEVRQRRRKRRSGTRGSQPSTSAGNPEGGCTENDLESSRENRGISPGLVWNPEKLAWGRGGTRSHTRHGNSSACNNKSSRNARLSKLVDYLRSLEEKNDELDVHLMLISFDKTTTPSLQQPYLCCRPSLVVTHLYEYVAHHTPLQAEQVEILLVKGDHNPDDKMIKMDELQILQGKETLAGLKAICSSSRDHLILAYRQKENHLV